MRVLVTGGAGYIGSVITDQLIDDAHGVVVYDNLSKGHRESVSEKATFIAGDLLDQEAIADALKKQGTPVWLLIAKDEGHGYRKKPNQDFQFYSDRNPVQPPATTRKRFADFDASPWPAFVSVRVGCPHSSHTAPHEQTVA